MNLRAAAEALEASGATVEAIGARVRLSMPDPESEVPPEALDAARLVKAHLLQHPPPHFTEAEERRLVDAYCNAARPERLAIYRRQRAIAEARPAWTWRQADLCAMQEHFDGTGTP